MQAKKREFNNNQDFQAALSIIRCQTVIPFDLIHDSENKLQT